ncbi:hypothetical protein ZIOFF_068601 [Zingiber officinale]|uniref:Uncharacterized protein n=1 Tax=Zingiber officinale TaxID=94328 RepID=A0A8J5EV29_ZINOF|nr:hypothetical protein ZIOFF_068601 [Zingiber officinale]
MEPFFSLTLLAIDLQPTTEPEPFCPFLAIVPSSTPNPELLLHPQSLPHGDIGKTTSLAFSSSDLWRSNLGHGKLGPDCVPSSEGDHQVSSSSDLKWRVLSSSWLHPDAFTKLL